VISLVLGSVGVSSVFGVRVFTGRSSRKSTIGSSG